LVAQILDADVLVDPGLFEDLVRAGAPDAVDVGQGDDHALVARDVDAGETCHAALLGVLWRYGAESVPGPPPRGVPLAGSDPAVVFDRRRSAMELWIATRRRRLARSCAGRISAASRR